MFRGSGGSSPDPLNVVPNPFTVDLSGLALLLTAPAVLGEFLPASTWVGAELLRPETPLSDGLSSVGPEFVRRFDEAVARAVGSSASVGVQLSGGLDSLAVLSALLRALPDRRIVALTIDLIDDRGSSAGDVTRRLLAQLDIRCEHVLVPRSARGRARWASAGPRLDALPHGNAALTDLAERHGVEILLSGDGADELLGVPRFVARDVCRHQGMEAARRYLGDIAGTDPGLLGEAFAVAASTMGRRWSARWYGALAWPEWWIEFPEQILGTAYRHRASVWSRDWLRAQLDDLRRTRTASWAAWDAFHYLWPHDLVRPAGGIPEVSPFLMEPFFSYAVNLPPWVKYTPNCPHRYWRSKAPVLALLSPRFRSAAPHRKQYFSRAIAEAVGRTCDAPLCVASGLVDERALGQNLDVGLRLTLSAVEEWLVGALEAGAVIPGVSCGTSSQSAGR